MAFLSFLGRKDFKQLTLAEIYGLSELEILCISPHPSAGAQILLMIYLTCFEIKYVEIGFTSLHFCINVALME